MTLLLVLYVLFSLFKIMSHVRFHVVPSFTANHMFCRSKNTKWRFYHDSILFTFSLHCTLLFINCLKFILRTDCVKSPCAQDAHRFVGLCWNPVVTNSRDAGVKDHLDPSSSFSALMCRALLLLIIVPASGWPMFLCFQYAWSTDTQWSALLTFPPWGSLSSHWVPSRGSWLVAIFACPRIPTMFF